MRFLKNETQNLQASDGMGSLPSFAAQIANGRNAENRPFAALVANVSVAGRSRHSRHHSPPSAERTLPSLKNQLGGYFEGITETSGLLDS